MTSSDDDISLASRNSYYTHQSSGYSTHASGKEGASSKSDAALLQVYNAPAVAKKEEANVLRAKGLVALILVLAAGAVASSAYLLVRYQEQSDFENQFAGYASEIVTVSRQKADQFFNALDAFSLSIASQAASENSLRNTTWPFYAIPDWSRKAEKLAELTGVADPFIGITPIVQADERARYTEFANEQNPIWYAESAEHEGYELMTAAELVRRTIPFIHIYNDDFQIEEVSGPGEALPLFQYYPIGPTPGVPVVSTNIDTLFAAQTREAFNICKATKKPVIGFTQILVNLETEIPGSQIMHPIWDRADEDDEDQKMVAVTGIRLHWLDYFQNLLTEGEDGVIVVLQSACPRICDEYTGVGAREGTNILTYRIDGPDAVLLGERDMHDAQFDDLEVLAVFVDLDVDQSELPGDQCIPTLTLHVYPSADLKESFRSNNPSIYAAVVVVIFLFTSLVFLLYDHFVNTRQRKVMERIAKQDIIVSDVFPAAIRNRLYENQGKHMTQSQEDLLENDDFDPIDFEESFVGRSNIIGSAPLADLFPSVTVIFADIVGFTAWSSAREPQQVFVLLETIYGAFDKIAYRHSVFKVETVGDCYVAAAGLPEPAADHAVLACRFARDCLKKMKEITLKLEVSLGPDTADLDLRTGIHSGQVTAGVLRGERSRFQLFGDTMNTAARMESRGERNRIQISQATADLVTEAGFDRWVVPRSSKIFVKGKGDMQTYWVRNGKSFKGKPRMSEFKSGMGALSELDEEGEHSQNTEELDFDFDTVEGMSKIERLVEWNVAVLTSLLQQIIGSRSDRNMYDTESLCAAEGRIGNGATVLEEFVPIIPLKRFQAEELRQRRRPSSIDIGDQVKFQLRNYLTAIAGMYQDNPFHNFEHASHVTASVKKLLTRIVNMDEGNGLGRNTNHSDHVDLVDLAGHSYGITSDPLTQFAVVFSAIVHDVDHPGVPNSQLVRENTRSAQVYKKSVAEQNSVEIAWDMLMGDEYKELRACIYQTEAEVKRFRQLVVNTVMATDIVDKELQALRKARWETAFSNVDATSSLLSDDNKSDDRKATIVIEHLIQASDVSHTMQHWHIYKSWNEKFFMECYGAYKAGRAESDPSINWYKGEIGFFDFYVIPLAKKLHSCGVFGVSSDEYLNYATANRDEWVREGEGLMKEYLRKYHENRKPS